MTTTELAELDAVIGKPLWGTAELVLCHRLVPKMMAALKAAWAKEKQPLRGMALVDAADEQDRIAILSCLLTDLAARLAEAERLLRAATEGQPKCNHGGSAKDCFAARDRNGGVGRICFGCQVAAFLARTTPQEK